jgi:hypothetical protein
MSRLILFFAPGLGRRFVHKGTMPWLTSALNPSCFAELVPPFPCLPEVVIHSALCGQSPAVHGRVLTQDEGEPTRAAASVANFAPQLRVEIDAGLLQCARAEGLDAPSRLAKATELDEKLRELFAAREEGALLLVAGLAGAKVADERIAWEDLSCFSAREVDVESAILRVRCARASRREEVREALLRLRGVERVLQGEALAAFGVPEEEGALILALAREGFSFEEEKASVGSPECAPGEEGVLLALGCHARAAWPSKLHALRLAPSVAAHLGHSTQDYADRPFPL